MPILLVLSLVAQFVCGYHAVKNGHDRYWLYLIIIAPGLGCLIYAVAIMIPSMTSSREGKQAIKAIKTKLDPTATIRALQDQLSLRDTPEIRTKLAIEYTILKQYQDAIEQYQLALVGHNANHADTLLKLAEVYFLDEQYQQCIQTLCTLLERNPSYVSPEGHLLQARALEGSGDLKGADECYRQVVDYYSGPEANLYYAQFLLKQNRPEQAKKQLEEILSYARIAPKHYKRFHKACFAEAQKMHKSLNSSLD